MRKSGSWLSLLGFGATVAGVAWWSSRRSPMNSETKLWYERLAKPPFNPPDAVFPVVWSGLYALIAFSGWRIWREPESPERSRALGLWALQMALNAEWTQLFFGEHRPGAALADVIAMEAAIVQYIFTVREIDPIAAGSFVPYAAWVAFATVLNAEIVRRNPDAETLAPSA